VLLVGFHYKNNPDLTPSECHLFVPLSLQGYYYVNSRHCRMMCTNGCRGGRATLTGWENVLLFKGGRKSETTLKSEYAFSGVVVKFC